MRISIIKSSEPTTEEHAPAPETELDQSAKTDLHDVENGAARRFKNQNVHWKIDHFSLQIGGFLAYLMFLTLEVHFRDHFRLFLIGLCPQII